MKSSFLNAPEFLSLPFFGLNINQTSVKITKLKKTSVGFIPHVVDEVLIHNVCDFFTDTNTYSECEELKKILTDLKKKYSMQFVQLAVSEESTYVFKILIPNEALDLADEFILNNIDQYIPLNSEDVYFDYRILDSHKTGENTPAIVTAIPKNILEKYSKLLDSCGMFLISVEPETHALARCLIQKGDLNPYILININQYATNISVVEEGFVQYTQTIPINTQSVINDMTPDIANLLKDSIKKVIIYWFTSKDQSLKTNKIENVILTGENMDSSELVNFLESNLSVNASIANVWKNCFDINTYVPQVSKKDSLKYAICIGLSLFNLK